MQAAAGVAANPGTASFSGATAGSAAFAAAGDGVDRATLASGDLDPGLREEQVDATVDGQPASASDVTSGASAVAERAGPGAHAWDGGGASPGDYTLRVLDTEPGGPCCAPSRWSSTASGRGSPTPGPPPTRSSPGPATATATPPPSP